MFAGPLVADVGTIAGSSAGAAISSTAARRGLPVPAASTLAARHARSLRVNRNGPRGLEIRASASFRKEGAYPKSNVELLEGDAAFIQDRLENDPPMAIDALTAARDQMLNLLARKPNNFEDVDELKRQVQVLQARLDDAHVKAHEAEAKLASSLGQLAEVEKVAQQLNLTTEAREAAMAAVAIPTAPEAPVQNPNLDSFDDEMDNSGGRRGYVPPGQGRPLTGLQSNLEVGEGLKNFWYAIHFSSQVKEDMLVPLEAFGEPWVLFRDENGKIGCVQDSCAHRACPLSLGKIENGNVQCAYHGWEFSTSGDCEKMPSVANEKKSCKGVKVRSLPVKEVEGMIFIWPGSKEPEGEPHMGLLPESGVGYENHAEIVLEVPVEHGLLLENLLDLAHAPFTHTSTFAKGWPVPDLVKWSTDPLSALAGAWEPYPITMSFEPPCMVLSTIGLAQPGKIRRGLRAEECEKHLHQLHVCVPSKPGHTRLLYRMHLDFLPWVKHVPGIKKLWEEMANQVLGEDLRLVAGQQDRMLRGADVWGSPVVYDKLGVRYRRWRNDNQGEV